MGDGAGRRDGEGGAGRAKEFGVTTGCRRALARAASSRFTSRPCRAAIPDPKLGAPVELQSPLQSRRGKLKAILPKSVVSDLLSVSPVR